MGNVVCLVNLVALIASFLGGSILKVDIAGAVKKIGDFRFWTESYAWSVSFYSGPCTFKISCGNRPKIP